MQGSTVPTSSARVSEYSAAGPPGVRNRPCARAYASTRATWDSGRPERRRYARVSASMGKMPQVAPYSGAMFAIVARSASGRWSRPSPKNSTNLPTTPFSRSICTTVSTRSVAVAPSGSFPVSSNPTTWGMSIEIGWPSIAALRLDPADPPAEHPQPVDHRGMRIGADHRVRVCAGHAAVLAREDDAGEVLQVDLVDDAGTRRHHLEVPERLLSPAQECVPLPVAFEFDRVVARERVAGREPIDLHRVVDHQLHRRERVDLRRIAAERAHRVAHRGQIDHRRYPP